MVLQVEQVEKKTGQVMHQPWERIKPVKIRPLLHKIADMVEFVNPIELLEHQLFEKAKKIKKCYDQVYEQGDNIQQLPSMSLGAVCEYLLQKEVSAT